MKLVRRLNGQYHVHQGNAALVDRCQPLLQGRHQICRVFNLYSVATEGVNQLGVVGAGDVDAVPDVGAGSVAVRVVVLVVAAHGLIVAVVEDDGQEGEVGLTGHAEALGYGVVEEAAVAHQGHHRAVGHSQLDAQGQAQALSQAAVGVEVALRPVPLDVAHDLAPVGGYFLGIGGVVGHGLGDGGAQPYRVDGPTGAGGVLSGLAVGGEPVVFGGPMFPTLSDFGSVGAIGGAVGCQGLGQQLQGDGNVPFHVQNRPAGSGRPSGP